MKEFLETWKSILLGASVRVFACGLVSESESTRKEDVGASVARGVSVWEGGLGLSCRESWDTLNSCLAVSCWPLHSRTTSEAPFLARRLFCLGWRSTPIPGFSAAEALELGLSQTPGGLWWLVSLACRRPVVGFLTCQEHVNEPS